MNKSIRIASYSPDEQSQQELVLHHQGIGEQCRVWFPSQLSTHLADSVRGTYVDHGSHHLRLSPPTLRKNLGRRVYRFLWGTLEVPLCHRVGICAILRQGVLKSIWERALVWVRYEGMLCFLITLSSLSLWYSKNCVRIPLSWPESTTTVSHAIYWM